MLEYALPAQAWTFLKWPAKASYKDQTARFKDIRDRYLCRGGFHPMGRMIEMLRYGRASIWACYRAEGRLTGQY